MSGWHGRYLDLISGRNRSLTARCLRAALTPISWGYAAGNWWYHRLYDWQLRETVSLPVPVISIGNLTAGGTGKTPLVATLAHWFQAQGIRAGLLSRGYNAAPGQQNDEWRVLELACPGTPHVQNRDRVSGGLQLIADSDVEVILLDDGYQHRKIARDLNVALIDALCPWGHGALLPRGLQREPLSALKRADLILMTRTDLVEDSVVASIQREAARHCSATVICCTFPPRQLRNAAGQTRSLEGITGNRVSAFCGIGNPEGFRATLTECGVNLISFRAFPDHHHYSEKDFAQLQPLDSGDGPPEIFLTTVKDLVKIPHVELHGIPLWAVETATWFPEGIGSIEPFLDRICALIPDNEATRDG